LCFEKNGWESVPFVLPWISAREARDANLALAGARFARFRVSLLFNLPFS